MAEARENELVAKLNEKDAALTQLQSERDKLLEVVRPFANCAAPFGADWADADEMLGVPEKWWSDEIRKLGDEDYIFAITVGDLRKARDVRNEIDAGKEGATISKLEIVRSSPIETPLPSSRENKDA